MKGLSLLPHDRDSLFRGALCMFLFFCATWDNYPMGRCQVYLCIKKIKTFIIWSSFSANRHIQDNARSFQTKKNPVTLIIPQEYIP